MRQCPANLSTLSLSDVCRDQQNNSQMKNLQNPFLVECSPLMVPTQDVSSCSSWCYVFALNSKDPERTEFLKRCNSTFPKPQYRPFKLELVTETGNLSSIRKLTNVQPCGPLTHGNSSFVIDIKICNCTGGGKNFTMLGTKSEEDSVVEYPNSSE